jgi:hypothetical protein
MTSGFMGPTSCNFTLLDRSKVEENITFVATSTPPLFLPTSIDVKLSFNF